VRAAHQEEKRAVNGTSLLWKQSPTSRQREVTLLAFQASGGSKNGLRGKELASGSYSDEPAVEGRKGSGVSENGFVRTVRSKGKKRKSGLPNLKVIRPAKEKRRSQHHGPGPTEGEKKLKIRLEG